jgi:hypothetical protein
MSEKITLVKNVFDKDKFTDTVNINFNQVEEQELQETLPTVEDFFLMYDKLFFNIPKEGELNSHEFLIKTSTEYIGFEPISEQIQALIEEINTLRFQNLTLQQENIQKQIPNENVDLKAILKESIADSIAINAIR